MPLASLGPVLVVRDEKFFQNQPILMVIEPVSAAILGIWALSDRQAETWALALRELTDQILSADKVYILTLFHYQTIIMLKEHIRRLTSKGQVTVPAAGGEQGFVKRLGKHV